MRLPAILGGAQRPTAMVASAKQLGGVSDNKPPPSKPRGDDWAEDAAYHYDNTGTVWIASQFLAKLLSRVTFYVARGDATTHDRLAAPAAPAPDAKPGAELSELEVDALAWQLFDDVRDQNGGRATLQYRYGQLMFLFGDARLVFIGRVDEQGKPFDSWEMLSRDEITKKQPDAERYTRKDGVSGDQEYLDLGKNPDALPTPDLPVAMVYRFWRPHPRFSGQADSPLRASLLDADEIALIGRATRSQYRIRSSGPGVLFLPSEMRAPLEDPNADPSDPKNDKVMQEILDALYAAISDEQAETAAVPLVIRSPGESIDKVRHVTFSTPSDKDAGVQLRTAAMERIAMQLDMPKEWLTGAGDLNHWNLWGVKQEAWDSFGSPAARMFAEDWTSGYLRATLIKRGVPRDVAARYLVAVDPSAVIIPADRTNDAKQAHDIGAISDEAYRGASGWRPEDAPSLDAPNSNPALVSLYRAPYTGPGQQAPQPAGPFQQPPPASSGDAGDGQADPGPPASGQASLEHEILGACRAQVWQARRYAGNRLRTKAAKPATPADVRRVVDETVNVAQLAAVLGEARVQSTLNGSGPLRASELVRDDAALAAMLADVDAPMLLSGQLRAAVLEHAAATLYSLDPGPLSERVCHLARMIAVEARA